MSIILPFFLAAILLFSFTTNISAQETEEEKPPNNDIIVDAMMQINLVMIGDTWSQEEQKAIGDKLLKSYMPNIYYEERAAGVNYTYNYSFRNMTAEKSDELVTYIDAIAEDPPADWMPYIAEWISFVAESREEIPPFVNLRNDTYKMISAFAVEEWLAKLERDKGYTIYFLKPVNEKVNYFLEEPSEAKVNYFHTYGTVDTDPDTGIEFIQQGMMGFGGKYRFYFIDLNAGPWLYPYPQFHKNIFDIETEDEYHELIAGYVNNALLLLFMPRLPSLSTYAALSKTKIITGMNIVSSASSSAIAACSLERLLATHLLSSMIRSELLTSIIPSVPSISLKVSDRSTVLCNSLGSESKLCPCMLLLHLAYGISFASALSIVLLLMYLSATSWNTRPDA